MAATSRCTGSSSRPKVTKDIATDAKVRLEVPRAKFNDLATKGHIKTGATAFEHGDAKVTGIDQIIKLIVNVVERQEERARTRHAKTHQLALEREFLGVAQLLLDEVQARVPEPGVGEVDADHGAQLLGRARAPAAEA